MEPSAKSPDEPTSEQPRTRDEAVDHAIDGSSAATNQGPDPVIGAGLVLFGIFVMGLGGSRDWHYVFNVGTLVAIVGAALFVLFVALSAMKQSSSGQTKPQGT